MFSLFLASGGGYNRSRNDDRGYNRSRNDYQSNDDRGSSGGYSRGRNDHNDDYGGGGGGGYNRNRNDYQSSGGGGGYGGDEQRMETQHDTIFVQNLPKNVTVDELKDVFSQIGIIKVKFSDFNVVFKTNFLLH